MRQITLLLLIILSKIGLTIGLCQEATDTIYFNKIGKVCLKEEATLYRLYEHKDSLCQVKDFFMTGEVRMIGFSSTCKEPLFHIGEFKYYNINGTVSQIRNFHKNNNDGLQIDFFDSGITYSIISVKEGVRDGDSKYFFPTGELRRYEKYLNGELLTKQCYDIKGKEVPYYPSLTFPEFIGGQEQMYKYINKNLKYPKEAYYKKIEGIATVFFLVEKDGTITDVYCNDNIDAELKKEAIRVIAQMPKWKPGTMNDIPNKVKMKVRVTFKI